MIAFADSDNSPVILLNRTDNEMMISLLKILQLVWFREMENGDSEN